MDARQLKLHPHMEEGIVSLAPELNLESAYDSVKPSSRPENFKEIARIAKDEKAERTVRELMGE